MSILPSFLNPAACLQFTFTQKPVQERHVRQPKSYTPIRRSIVIAATALALASCLAIGQSWPTTPVGPIRIL